MSWSTTRSLALALALLGAARGQEPASPQEGAMQFGLAVWRAAGAQKPDENACLGPLSVSCALGMTALGAGGETRAEMHRVLGLKDTPQAHAALAGLLRLPSQEGVLVLPANRLFLARRFQPRAPFLQAAATAYQADAVQVDFAPDPEVGRKVINEWVAERTQQKIPTLLGASDVNRGTPLVLVNALYVKASWATKFDPARTAPAAFQLLSGPPVQVPTMRLEAQLPCAEAEDGLRLCELPYQGGRLAALILLPPAGKLRALEARLEPAALQRWVGALRQQKAELALPRFEVRKHAELQDLLQELGMQRAFQPSADFSGMSADPLMIAKVIHEAFLRVDEEGSEAAAATAVVMAPGGPPPGAFRMTVDRPFLLLIRDRTTGALLFVARVTDPR